MRPSEGKGTYSRAHHKVKLVQVTGRPVSTSHCTGFITSKGVSEGFLKWQAPFFCYT